MSDISLPISSDYSSYDNSDKTDTIRTIICISEQIAVAGQEIFYVIVYSQSNYW